MRTYVLLRLAAERYAVPVSHVREIIALEDMTPVPGAPACVTGVQRLRGQILPVIDLAQLLGISRQAPSRLLLIAEADGLLAGLAVDEVSQVTQMADPHAETESDLLTGATLADGELIGVVDIPSVMTTLMGAAQ